MTQDAEFRSGARKRKAPAKAASKESSATETAGVGQVLPLFYTSVTPLSVEHHRELGVAAADPDFGYAARANMIPAVFEEFATAAPHLPIVFTRAGSGISAVFLCGLQGGRNVFVDANNAWTRPYIPAYLRRYPFILGEVADAEPLLCFDSNSSLLVQEGERQRLLDEDGAPTEFANGIITLVRDYAVAARRTEEGLALLSELNLFTQVTLDAKSADGSQKASLTGVSVIDETRLTGLSDVDFLKIRKAGLLPAIYAHLFSMKMVNVLMG